MSILDGFKGQGTSDSQSTDTYKTGAVTPKAKEEPKKAGSHKEEPKRLDHSKAHIPAKGDKKKKGFFGSLIGGGTAEDRSAGKLADITKASKKPIDMELDDHEIWSYDQTAGLDSGSGFGSGFGSSFGSGSGFISYKPLENKQLSIIVIENSEETNKIKNMISTIVGSYGSNEKNITCVVNYGSMIHFSELIDPKSLKDLPALVENDIGSSARFYDAFCALSDLISAKKKSIEDDKSKRININSIEILGIGTCKDVGSTHSKVEAISAFDEIIKDSTVTTKYFCLTEDGFKEAAEFGFKSIGSISITYQ